MGPRRSRKTQKTSNAAVKEKVVENHKDESTIKDVQTESNTVVNEKILKNNKKTSGTKNVPDESIAVVNEEITDKKENTLTTEEVPDESNAVVNEDISDKKENASTTEKVPDESNAVVNEEISDKKENALTTEKVTDESNAVGNEEKNENVSVMEEVSVESSTELLNENKACDNIKTTSVNQSEEPSAEPGVVSLHPYAEAIEKCPYHNWQLEEKDPEPLTTLEETQFTMVGSKEELGEMMNKLKAVKEIAVASKYDKFMSFKGKNCLVQISTRTEDFFIDFIALKDSMQVLNDLFSDLNILKVMYKADNFLSSLNNDFTVYLVNLFDVHIASRDISDEEDITHQDSLSTILKQHCSINLPYKKRGGWNRYDVRPLPADLVRYARQETHYMLHAKDKLQNALIKKNILKQFYTNCNRICSTMSHTGQDLHTRFKPEDYESILDVTTAKDLNKAQVEVIRLLFAWRYETAKTHDKGPAYILPNKSLISIARRMPKDTREIQACVIGHQFSPVFKQNLEVIRKLISKAVKDFPSPTGPGAGSFMTGAKRKFTANNANIDQKRRKKHMPHYGIGNNFRPFMGPRTQPFMNSGMRPMMGPKSTMGPNSMMSPNSMMGSNPILGPNSMMRGPRICPSMQLGMGRRVGSMMSPRMGPRMAQPPWDQKPDPIKCQGMGSGMGSRMGQPPWEQGSGEGSFIRPNPMNGLRMGSGTGPGMGSRVSPGIGLGMGAKKGPVIGVATGLKGPVGRKGVHQQHGQQMNKNRERYHDALASAIAKVIVHKM